MISICQPPAENELTGGYLYNQRIAAALGDAEVVRVQPAQLASAIAERQETSRHILVDSLYIHDDTDLEALSKSRAIALIHHLPSLDPGFPEDRRAVQASREAAFLSATNGCVVTSTFMRHLLRQRDPSARIAVCPPGVDDEFFRVEPAPSSIPPSIITVANLEPRKGYLEHVEAMARLARSHDFHWHIVGDESSFPEYARAVADRVEAEGIRGLVTLHGRLGRRTLLSLLGRVAVHLFPTRFETYGMVVTESVAAGIPVVAPRLGEIPRLVDDGITGLLAPPHDPDALVDQLARALADPALLAKLQSGARAHRACLPRWSDAAATMRRSLES